MRTTIRNSVATVLAVFAIFAGALPASAADTGTTGRSMAGTVNCNAQVNSPIAAPVAGISTTAPWAWAVSHYDTQSAQYVAWQPVLAKWNGSQWVAVNTTEPWYWGQANNAREITSYQPFNGTGSVSQASHTIQYSGYYAYFNQLYWYAKGSVSAGLRTFWSSGGYCYYAPATRSTAVPPPPPGDMTPPTGDFQPPTGDFQPPTIEAPAPAPHSSRVTAVVSDSRIRRGDTIKVTGAVLPKHRGEVTLQRSTGSGWKGIKKAALNANSRYVFRGVKPAAGTTKYRVLMPAHGDHAKVVSPVRTVIAR